MAARRDVVLRGVRFGMRVGSVPAMIWGGVWAGGVVAGLVRWPWHGVLAMVGKGLIAVLGSLGVGLLLGLVVGAVLALVPTWLVSRVFLRGLLAAFLGGVLFLGEVLVIGVATDGGYGPMLLALLAVPVVAAIAAVHSGDIAGRSHRHAWLWPLDPNVAGLGSAPGKWRSKALQALKLFW